MLLEDRVVVDAVAAGGTEHRGALSAVLRRLLHLTVLTTALSFSQPHALRREVVLRQSIQAHATSRNECADGALYLGRLVGQITVSQAREAKAVEALQQSGVL